MSKEFWLAGKEDSRQRPKYSYSHPVLWFGFSHVMTWDARNTAQRSLSAKTEKCTIPYRRKIHSDIPTTITDFIFWDGYDYSNIFIRYDICIHREKQKKACQSRQ